MTPFRPDRRRFLKLGAGTTLAGLVLGINWSCVNDTPEPGHAGAFAPNAWLRVDPQGRVTVIVAESEMGQGPHTALPMLVAEELEVDWADVRVERAPLKKVYGFQLTGGSNSVRKGWGTLREAGAIAREILLQAAARDWGVPVETCRAESGRVVHTASGRRIGYGELAERAADLPIPATARLKEPHEFRLIGTPAPRVDIPDKLNGRARFGIDVKRPGMRYATLVHCPVFGGKPRRVDDRQARAIRGVLDVFTIEEGVVVLASDTWSAFRGRAALEIEWDDGEGRTLSNASLVEAMNRRGIDDGTRVAHRGDPQALLGEPSLTRRYTLPFQAHAPLEPMNCTASVENGRLRIWAPTQSPSRAYEAAREATQSTLERIAGQVERKLFDSDPDDIEINTTLLGGGFGRRLQQDYVREAARIARRVDHPVQLVWTREEDLQHDFYHPLTQHDLSARLDGQGQPLAWHHTIRGPGARHPGASGLPYAIPNLRVDLIDIGRIVPVGAWRSVEHHYNAFAVEHFFDEVARAGGQDPLQQRLRLLTGEPRLRKTLEEAAERSGWSYGTGRFGAASHACFGSYASEVVELEEANGRLRIGRITCVVDCGIVINPDIARAQVESAVVFGLTAALKSAIRIDQGRVEQHNFHDYPILTLAETPAIEVHLIPSRESPGGMGEPGVPPVAPAIANALLAATGESVSELPLPYDQEGFERARQRP